MALSTILSVVVAVMNLSRRTADNSLGEILRYQSEMSKLTLTKLDDLTSEVLNIRSDIQNALAEIDNKLEADRLTTYLDSLHASHRMFHLAMKTIQSPFSSETEKQKALRDLDECYDLAIAASSALRGYNGFIPALAISPSFYLICALISQTSRGSAALISEISSHKEWISNILNPNESGSLATITAETFKSFQRAREKLSVDARVRVSDATVDQKTQVTYSSPTNIDSGIFGAVIPAKTWDVWIPYNKSTVDSTGVSGYYETRSSPEQVIVCRLIRVVAREVVEGSSDLPTLFTTTDSITTATERGYDFHVVVDSADAATADLIIKNNDNFKSTLAKQAEGARAADTLNASRALYRIYRHAERSLKNTQTLIDRQLDLL